METSCITDITMVLTIEIRYEADELEDVIIMKAAMSIPCLLNEFEIFFQNMREHTNYPWQYLGSNKLNSKAIQ